jgi:hypothetical protein
VEFGGKVKGSTQKEGQPSSAEKAVATIWTQNGHRAISADFFQPRAGVTGSVLVKRENEY